MFKAPNYIHFFSIYESNYLCLFFYFWFCLVLLFFPIYTREVMSCYIRKFPGEIRNQGWQGGMIATTRDENF